MRDRQDACPTKLTRDARAPHIFFAQRIVGPSRTGPQPHLGRYLAERVDAASRLGAARPVSAEDQAQNATLARDSSDVLPVVAGRVARFSPLAPDFIRSETRPAHFGASHSAD